MSIDLSLDSLGDSFDFREDFISSLTRWYGRELTWDDFPQLFSDVERRIHDLTSRGDRQSELLIYKLAWMGASPEKRPLIERQIAHLIRISDGWEIRQVGFGKSCTKVWKSTTKTAEKAWDATCEVAEKAWDATCEIVEKTCDAVAEFWEENKQEILIATAVVATAVAVAAASIYTGGTAAPAAAAGGAAFINSLSDDSSDGPAFISPFPQPSSAGIALGELNPIPIAPFAPPPEVIVPTPPPAPPQPIFRPFDPQLNLEDLYGRNYVSRLYEQFLLPDPYLQITPPLNAPIDTLPKGPTIGEFITLIETKLAEPRSPDYLDKCHARDAGPPRNQPFLDIVAQKLEEAASPNYADQWKPRTEDPSNAQQFRELLAQKLDEPANPNYLENLKHLNERPPYKEQFLELIAEKLREVEDPGYKTTLQTIDALFTAHNINTPPHKDNYASLLSAAKPAAPFYDIPLLGFLDQSTVHFHCGINNNVSTIVEGGLCLNTALEKGYAIQPHLVHSNSLIRGLTFVGLERLDRGAKEILPTEVKETQLAPFPLEVPDLLLENSQIQRSIDYEVESLTRIAQNIIKQNKPNLKQMHVTFSNGGHVFKEALKQLPQEYRDTIIVITTGTTAIIEDDLAHLVYNVIGEKDWPSISCNGGLSGIEQAKNKGARVELIKQAETQSVIGGHYFIQPDYQDVVSEFVKNKIANTYEIY